MRFSFFLSLLCFLFSLFCINDQVKADSQKIAITRGNQTQIISVDDFYNFPFLSGDKLAILPSVKAKNITTTPDGHKHILDNFGKPIRIPSEMILIPYKEYRIPEHLCILTGAGTSTLDSIGGKHVENYSRYMGLWPEMTFLEIGCGIGRDVFQLLPIMGNKGKYIGIDVTRDSIIWLEKNITTTHTNFSFYHFDARHELYNPLGA